MGRRRLFSDLLVQTMTTTYYASCPMLNLGVAPFRPEPVDPQCPPPNPRCETSEGVGTIATPEGLVCVPETSLATRCEWNGEAYEAGKTVIESCRDQAKKNACSHGFGVTCNSDGTSQCDVYVDPSRKPSRWNPMKCDRLQTACPGNPFHRQNEGTKHLCTRTLPEDAHSL